MTHQKFITRYVIALVFALANLPAFSQKPEPIYSFAIVRMPVQYYKTQAALWKKEVDKNSSDGTAWYNYYRATRNMARTDTTNERFAMAKAQLAIVEEMGKAIPESYEYNLIKWMESPKDKASEQYLLKAARLGEGHTEYLQDMMILSELHRETGKRHLYAKQYTESPFASAGMMYYHYNVLSGLKPNAIIVSVGDNDTYPIWMLQSMGIRTDVTVINSSLIRIDSYRDILFKELGIGKYVNDTNDRTNKFDQGLLKHMAKNTGNRRVYLSLTAPCDEFTAGIPDNIFLTGLAYEYSDKPIDNIAQLKRNFEQLYALDYIDKPFYRDISKALVEEINANYIVPMIKLYAHYQEAGESQKAAWIRAKIITIAKGRDDEKEIMQQLNKS